MNCSFISTLRQLSNLSSDAVANIDLFDELKQYLHVVRSPEKDLRDLLASIDGVSQKQLVLVCGSAGDGKSHLLSYLKNKTHLLDNYTVINDATESEAPNKTAIVTLANRISAFSDTNLCDAGAERIILAINLGMLKNFIDSDEGQDFSTLKQYVENNDIFGIDKSLPFDIHSFFHHVDFSDYQLYTLTDSGVKSEYLTQLFRRIFAKTEENPFYKSYCNNKNCDSHTHCPIRHNFEFLANELVQDYLIQKIIEACIKYKLVVTSRDILSFIFDAIVPHDFNENSFWKTLNYPAKFIKQYIEYTTPMLVFDNKGTSNLIDHMSLLNCEDENTEQRDSELLNFYANDEITNIISEMLSESCYKNVILNCDLPAIDNERDLKRYLYQFSILHRDMLNTSGASDTIYDEFVRDLYCVYAGRNRELRSLYDAVSKSIFSWYGSFGDGMICLDDSNDHYNILEKLSFSPYLLKTDEKDEIIRFLPTITVRYKSAGKEENGVVINLDYSLYKLIFSMKSGYRPSSQDNNVHADFVSKIKALAESGEKTQRIVIVPKDGSQKMRYVFEENEFGYSFREVRL